MICYRRVGFRKRTAEESSRSAEVIASNDDLLTELLLWVPVKSLLKFKCVCKHWFSLISDPHFACRKYLKSNAVSAFYLDCDSTQEAVKYYEVAPLDFDDCETVAALDHLDFAGCPRRIQIEHSCNGLLLIRSVKGEKYMVYNPTTEQSKTLPFLPPLRPWAEMYVLGANLAFDPSKSHFYQVFCILGRWRDLRSGCQILIYSSETGRWRVFGAPITPHPGVGFGDAVYCNDAVHWYSQSDNSLYFDMNEELVREMPMPLPPEYCEELHRYFGESGGCLYLVDSYEDLTRHLDVYEMEIDRSGWFLKFRVGQDLLARFIVLSKRIHLMSVLYVARGEKEGDSFMVLHISDDKIIRCNFASQTHQVMGKFVIPVDNCIFISPPAYPYIESLCPV